jgi:hypothetical protein
LGCRPIRRSNAECSRPTRSTMMDGLCTSSLQSSSVLLAAATTNPLATGLVAVLEASGLPVPERTIDQRERGQRRLHRIAPLCCCCDCASVTCIWAGPAHGCGCLGKTRRQAHAVVLAGPSCCTWYLQGVLEITTLGRLAPARLPLPAMNFEKNPTQPWFSSKKKRKVNFPMTQ